MSTRYSDLRWSKYTLPDGRAVYLTQRPDRAMPVSVGRFIRDQKPVVRFCFTDDIVPAEFPYGGVPWHWFPWVPNKNIPIENVYAFISSFAHYINTTKNSQDSFWLHCDSSSMRAPTYFGLALKALYPNHAQDICERMTVSEGFDINYAKNSRADTYANVSLSKDPGIAELIDAWQNGGEESAYAYYMGNKKQFDWGNNE